MDIINLDNDTLKSTAYVVDLITKQLSTNHRVILQNNSGNQTLDCSFSQIVTVRYDNPLVAYIEKNGDI